MIKIVEGKTIPLPNFEEHIKSIEEIEIELTGTCNLDCPICLRTINHPGKNKLSIDFWIDTIKSFPNLKRICIAGSYSEPTLYKGLFDIIKYLGTTDLQCEFYTNSSLYNTDYWRELGKIFPENIKIYFTICGTTEELHQKYRRGSTLKKVLENAYAFLETYNYKNDYLQYIKFSWNLKDSYSPEYYAILDNFHNEEKIESIPYNERFSIDNKEYNMISHSDAFLKIKENTLKLFEEDSLKKPNIYCKSIENKFLYIDQYGVSHPCFIFAKEHKFYNQFSFKNINENKFKSCWGCDTSCVSKLNRLNIDRME